MTREPESIPVSPRVEPETTAPASAPRAPRESQRRLARAAQRQIAAELPNLIKNLITLAAGVTVEKADAKSKVNTKTYTQPPDRQANEYLIDRVLGKVSTHSERQPRGGTRQRAIDAAVAEAMQDAARRVLADRDGLPPYDGPP